MATAHWEPAAPGKFVPGETYRVKGYVSAPYTRVNVMMVKAALRLKFDRKNVSIIRIFDEAPMYSAHGTGATRWPVTVEFIGKEATINESELDPRALLALAAVIAVAGITFYMVESKVEHLVTATADAVSGVIDHTKDLVAPVFNPVTLILGVVGVYLFTRSK